MLSLLAHRERFEKDWLEVIKKGCQGILEELPENLRVPLDEAVEVFLISKLLF